MKFLKELSWSKWLKSKTFLAWELETSGTNKIKATIFFSLKKSNQINTNEMQNCSEDSKLLSWFLISVLRTDDSYRN